MTDNPTWLDGFVGGAPGPAGPDGPQGPAGSGAVGSFSPTDPAYGCPWDGIHDDLPGWTTMMAAIPDLGATIYLPPGTGYFSGKVVINKPVDIRGADATSGMTFAPGYGIVFEDSGGHLGDNAGITGVALQSKTMQPGLQDYDIHADRANSTYYALGRCVSYTFNTGSRATISAVVGDTVTLTGLTASGDPGVSAGAVGHLMYLDTFHNRWNRGLFLITARHSNDSVDVRIMSGAGTLPDSSNGSGYWFETHNYIFRASVAGTSASSGGAAAVRAAMAAATAHNVNVTDGSVTWTSEAVPIDFQPNKTYAVGERAKITGDLRYAFECMASTGPAGATFGVQSAGVGGTFLDTVAGTTTWKTLSYALQTVRTGAVRSSNMTYTGCSGPGYAVDNTYVGPTSLADHCTLVGAAIYNCGIGILTQGDDANAIYVSDIKTFTMGGNCCQVDDYRTGGTVGTGGFAVYDRGEGNSFKNMYAQFAEAPAYYTHGTNSSATFLECRVESNYGDVTNGTCTHLGQCKVDISSASLVVKPYNLFNLTGVSRTAAVPIYSTPGFGNVFSDFDQRDAINIPTESGDYIGWTYGGSAFGATTQGTTARGTGWHAFDAHYYTTRLMNGFSGTTAAEGPFNWRTYEGEFRGMASPYYVGYDSVALTDPGIRGGLRKIGDVFYSIGTGVPGTWSGKVVSVQGYRGPHWQTGLTVYKQYHTTGIGGAYGAFPATIIEPSVSYGATGYAYQCTTGGVTHASVEPTWPTTIGNTVSDGTAVWTCVGILGVNTNLTGFVDDPVAALCPQTRMAWKDTAGTDATTAAAKDYVYSQRAVLQTTTSATNQTICTFAYDLPNDSTCVLDVIVKGKRNGNHASYISAKLSGTRGRNSSGAPEVVGTDDNTVKHGGSEDSLSAVTFDLSVTSNTPIVRVNNPPAYAVDWGVEFQMAVRVS